VDTVGASKPDLERQARLAALGAIERAAIYMGISIRLDETPKLPSRPAREPRT
jgi:hypothetical protein